MNYPCYCSKCDRITGHETSGLKSTCVVCGHSGSVPYVRWVLLPIIVIGLAAIPIYIILTSAFVQYALVACVALVGLLALYMRFQNSRYRVLLNDLTSKCTSAVHNAKIALKLQ